jgi:hypothetical protein
MAFYRRIIGTLLVVLILLILCSSFFLQLDNRFHLPTSDGDASTTTYSTKQVNTSHSSSSRKANGNAYLEHHFPECIVPNNRLNLTARRGRYSHIPSSKSQSQSHAARYDHVSCFVMKARYNCAYRPDHNFTVASDYELVWNSAKETTTTTTTTTTTSAKEEEEEDDDSTRDECNPRTVIDGIGGPQGIFQNLSLDRTSRHQRPYLNVLMQGNSYVRQIWEALVCGFATQITDLRVQAGGPGISSKALQHRQGRPVNQTGTSVNFTQAKRYGCHGTESADIRKYYRRRAILPPNNLANCNDNVAMVEFGHVVRFYYLFQPTMYEPETLQHIYKEFLGISKEDGVDVLVWNHVLKEPQNETVGLSVGRRIPVESWMWNLRGLQLRDLGRYFGANGPWIHNPPDFHSCLPGVPDDQVNLLLFLILTGYELDE